MNFEIKNVTDWKEDLKLGASAIWASLGFGAMLGDVMCLIYLMRKMNWKGAAKKSSMAMARIEKLSRSNSHSLISDKSSELQAQLLSNV